MLSSEGDGIWVVKDIVIATMSDKNWTRKKMLLILSQS